MFVYTDKCENVLRLASWYATETKEASITNKRNKSKFPTWRMQTSGLFIKRDRGFELGTTGKQIPLVTGWRP